MKLKFLHLLCTIPVQLCTLMVSTELWSSGALQCRKRAQRNINGVIFLPVTGVK